MSVVPILLMNDARAYRDGWDAQKAGLSIERYSGGYVGLHPREQWEQGWKDAEAGRPPRGQQSADPSFFTTKAERIQALILVGVLVIMFAIAALWG